MSDVVNRAATFLLYALIGRYLGAAEFGQMSLTLTLFYIFQILATAGLKPLITREVAKDRAKTGVYIVNCSIIVTISSLSSLALLFLFTRIMGYSSDTSSIILLLSFGLLPYSLSSIIEGIFQAWERMHYIAFTNVPVNIVKVGLAVLILHQGYGLYHLSLLLLCSYLIILVVESWLMFRCIARPGLSIDFEFSRRLIRTTGTFFGIDGIVVIFGNLNIILLSIMTSEANIGLYNAATQLIAPITLVYHNIVLSVFPLMCRRFESGARDLKQIAHYLIELLLAIALPSATGMFLLAEPLLVLLYGDEDFLLATSVLRILVGTVLLVALTAVIGHVLLASLREKVTLHIVLINGLIGLLIGVLFIRQLGLVGAAIAALVTNIVNFIQHFIPVSGLFSGLTLYRLAWKPAVASACMALYLTVMKSHAVIIVAASAGMLYIVIFLALSAWSCGGIGQLKAKYLMIWSNC